MQGISCVLFLPSQDSQLSPFLVYQFHSLSDLTFVAEMIKNDDNGNKHKVGKDSGEEIKGGVEERIFRGTEDSLDRTSTTIGTKEGSSSRVSFNVCYSMDRYHATFVFLLFIFVQLFVTLLHPLHFVINSAVH